jgi:ATP-dependent helicase/nuclease subunit B
MPKAIRPKLYTVPLGYSLADALAGYLLEQAGAARELLTDTLVLLPNNRAIKSLTDSFVRHAEKGLLLPRMVAIGDLNLDEAMGPLLDPIGDSALPSIPPAISDIERRILLARLIREQRTNITLVEALRLAKHLASALDQLDVEKVGLDQVNDKDLRDDLSAHWQSAYSDFLNIARAYQAELAKQSLLGPAARRNLLLDRFAAALPGLPSNMSVIAAGITTAAPAVADLLKSVSRLPCGMLVWPHVDLAMTAKDWDALGPIVKDEGTPPVGEETHPQFHLKLLFERMAICRDEIALFPGIKARPKLAAIDHIFCRADATLDWSGLKQSQKQLEHVSTLTAADTAEEALSIAILIRQALEQPEKRIALVTPDRELALRVAAQLLRWGVRVDDSAGQPLAQMPNATLLFALADLFAEKIGPVSLLSVLKHPLVKAEHERLDWLEQVRALDLLLRGPRPGIGLSAISGVIAAQKGGEKFKILSTWWSEVDQIFKGFDSRDNLKMPAFIELLTQAADRLTDGKVWQGQAGRQLAQLLENYRATDLDILGEADRAALPALMAQLLDSEVTRPVYGSHPRIAIYGLLEARLQQADLVICGGLNEGSWPQLAQPDPWLAPRLRRELKLPGLERNIGLAAHDLASLLGAAQVVLTRAERDRSGPTVASRFWLRMQALLGPHLAQEIYAVGLARIIDVGPKVKPAERPKPMPSREQRRVEISVTQVDMLKADPFSFYARNILNLKTLDAVGGEPSAAWRGTMVHDVLEHWAKTDKLDPDKLIARANGLLANPAFHPALRVLWQPRITAGLEWIAKQTAELGSEGRVVIAAESKGRLKIAGVELVGRADRIDKLLDGGFVVVDYKSGQPPTKKSVTAGFSLQLGLIGAMAEDGSIAGVRGTAKGFEYWSIAKNKSGGFGYMLNPVSDKDGEGADFVVNSVRVAREAIDTFILGDAPFVAKLHPDYALYGDYDQLMRLGEWYGRELVHDD